MFGKKCEQMLWENKSKIRLKIFSSFLFWLLLLGSWLHTQYAVSAELALDLNRVGKAIRRELCREKNE